jgi:hypothetical protein
MTPQFFKDEDGTWRTLLNANINGGTASTLLKIPPELLDNPTDQNTRAAVMTMLMQEAFRGWMYNAMEREASKGTQAAPGIAAKLMEQLDATIQAIKPQR